ncbi:hypothetical protein HNR60_000144 [Rhodopseudomonas rhenobacensis]|uniref:Uncharacterized protein n=1 Tax=Rhodopseudomonas rhenobacensis TaxID=87461 RepID=A0A7W7YZW0_9BRAD|nr:hypothetical protein [Rhodopseudomonas rhenobacensis]
MRRTVKICRGDFSNGTLTEHRARDAKEPFGLLDGALRAALSGLLISVFVSEKRECVRRYRLPRQLVEPMFDAGVGSSRQNSLRIISLLPRVQKGDLRVDLQREGLLFAGESACETPQPTAGRLHQQIETTAVAELGRRRPPWTEKAPV